VANLKETYVSEQNWAETLLRDWYSVGLTMYPWIKSLYPEALSSYPLELIQASVAFP
jgi:hypothetical protein